MATAESGPSEVQQQPSDALQIVVDDIGVENVPQDESRVSLSKQPRRDDMECPRAKLSIYRIPRHLKDGDKKAYVPQIVSLGPYHHGEEHLRPMEEHKWRCLHQILARSHHDIGRYLDSVKEVEQRARACYEGTISMSNDEFAQMMVLDGCFVIELLRGVNEGFKKLDYPSNDPVFSTWGSMLKTQIMRDMILLENQIPFFILDRLLGIQLGRTDLEERVGGLAFRFFCREIFLSRRIFLYGEIFPSRYFNPSSNQLHCLTVLLEYFLPPDLQQRKTMAWAQNREQLILSVTMLREAGIKLKNTYEESLGDIKFKPEDGILVIPQLTIHEGTRSLFLNLIAFEQSHFDCGNHITSYVIFMHNLMNSPEDVRYLRDHEIIKHCLGSDDEVVDLFNRLCRKLAFNVRDSYLFKLSKDLTDYCNYGFVPGNTDRRISIIKAIFLFFVGRHLARKWRAWIVTLKNKYFDSPWSIISLIAAFVLLVLTFIQALYAVYGYYRRRS